MKQFSRREFIAACSLGGLTGAVATGRGLPAAAGRGRAAAAPPETRWNRTHSTGPDDEAVAVRRSSGGLVVAGTTDLDGPGREMWLFELDGRGETVWERTYGEKTVTEATALVSKGGGYLLVGVTRDIDAEN
jgi:hypothetical protein